MLEVILHVGKVTYYVEANSQYKTGAVELKETTRKRLMYIVAHEGYLPYTNTMMIAQAIKDCVNYGHYNAYRGNTWDDVLNSATCVDDLYLAIIRQNCISASAPGPYSAEGGLSDAEVEKWYNEYKSYYDQEKARGKADDQINSSATLFFNSKSAIEYIFDQGNSVVEYPLFAWNGANLSSTVACQQYYGKTGYYRSFTSYIQSSKDSFESGIKNPYFTSGGKSSNGSSSSNSKSSLTSYKAQDYFDKIYIDENAVLRSEIDVEELWNNDNYYSRYLVDGSRDSLAYLLNAQLVTQYPYIESAPENSINGIVKFYRNDSIIPLEYVPKDIFYGYIDSFNQTQDIESEAYKKALKSFTIEKFGEIVIASYSSLDVTISNTDELDVIDDGAVEKHEKTLAKKSISYLSYVKSYTLPFDLLWDIVVWGHGSQHQGDSEALAQLLASMAYDGKIDIIVDDNKVVTTTIDKYTYTGVEYYSGTIEGGVYKNSELVRRRSATLNGSEDDSKETGEYSKTITTTSVNNNPSLKLKKVESWLATYNNTASFRSDSNTNSSSNNRDSDDAKRIEMASVEFTRYNPVGVKKVDNLRALIIKDFNDVKADSDEETSVTDYYSGELSREYGAKNIVEDTTIITIKTGYLDYKVNAHKFNKKLVRIFKSNAFYDVTYFITKENYNKFIKVVESAESTANLADVIRYTFNNVYDTDFYGKDLDFDTIWNSIYNDYNSVSKKKSGLDGNEGIIFDFLLSKGVTPQGAAAIIGNLYVESGCQPNNLENYYEDSLGMNDEQYTAKVNSGEYSRDSFTNDEAGYGLAQWTYYSRKQNLYDFAKSYSSNFDISNINMQLEFFWKELTENYPVAYAAVKNATDVEQATREFCDDFENPGIPNLQTRIDHANEVYQKYLSSSSDCNGSILEVAKSIHNYMDSDHNSYTYCVYGCNNYEECSYYGKSHGLATTFEKSKSSKNTCCATYVSWVLQNSGYISESDHKNECSALYNVLKNNGFTQVSANDLQPGDIMFYNNFSHTDIYAGNNTKYNAGSGTAIRAVEPQQMYSIPDVVMRAPN